MFAANAQGSLPPHLLAAMMAQSNLAPGGMNPPLPTSSPAGGQMTMGAMPKPAPGMFGAGAAPQSMGSPSLMPKSPSSASEAAVMHQQGQARFGGGSMGNPPGMLSLSGGGSSDGAMPSLGPDLNVALARNALTPKSKGGPNWGKIGQVISAGLAGYLAGRGNPAGLAMLQNNFQMQREQAEFRNREALERMKAQLPQQVGDSLIVPDGTGGFQTLFRDPQPFEAYAESLGFQPGSPEYLQAIQDYRLGSWSDPALQAKQELEGVRYGFRDNLQDQRLDVTRRGQDIRSTDTRRGQDITRGNNIRSTSTSRDNSVRSNETQRGAYSYTHGGGGKSKGAGAMDPHEGMTIVNPQTGQRMQRKSGQWVPIK